MIGAMVETDAEKIARLELALADAEREARELEDELEVERCETHSIEGEGARNAKWRALEILSDVERGIFTLAEAKVRIEGLDS